MPPEIVLVAVVILSVLGFAAFGFIKFLVWITSGPAQSQPDRNRSPNPQTSSTGTRSLQDDVLGASLLLNHLRLKKQIDDKTYIRIRRFLEDQYEGRIELADSCLLYTSPSPRDKRQSRMPSSA